MYELKPETALLILATAYDLLGDGQGGEWHENPEYTRAVVEMVHDTVGVPPGVVGHYGGDFRPFVLGMIYAANLVT